MVSTRATPRAKQATPDIDPSDYSALETHRKPSRFVHTPSYLILGWLIISVPLVIWDTGYILNRPHTMPGGWMHYPLWVPYALYGRIDHHYGPANIDFETGLSKNGFASAQGFLNAIETSMYIIYLAIVWRQGRPDHSVTGRSGAAAVLVLFSSLVMTFSKTVLYWMIEYYGAYSNVGHNELGDLILLWIIPNGLWLIFPAWIIYQLSYELVDSLAGPVPASKKTVVDRDARSNAAELMKHVTTKQE